MTCPFLARTIRTECRAVADRPAPLPRVVVASCCRERHASCPAYRYVRAAGRPLDPADFRAWVLDRISPGRTDPDPAYHHPGTDAG
jgi:hypothetical protein